MAQAWHFRSRPTGLPTADNFELKDLAQTEIGEGQIRVRNSWLSVDPYMRGRMTDAKSYVPGFGLGEPMSGGAVGRVVESRSPDFSEGDLVMHMAGWRDEAVIDASGDGSMGARKLPDLGLPDQVWLHNLGLTGATAYFGLLRTAEAKKDDVIFVSAAAGAVGSAVVQIAKLREMRVIGSAGGPEKCAWVKQLGAEACIDYKAGPVMHQLMAAAPDGIDVYFDNVGGDHLDAAFATARNFARFAICGMIEHYNDDATSPGQCFKAIIRTIPARIRMQGFIFTDYDEHMPEFIENMVGWVKTGRIKMRETVHEGLAATPDAFLGLFSGQNTGKMLVKV